MIATPTRGDVKTGYMRSVLATLLHFAEHGIDCYWETIEGSDIGLQRNLLANTFLRDTAATHLLFIDSDMTFSNDLGRRLVAVDRPIVGAVCSKRRFDVAGMGAALKQAHSPHTAYLFGLTWNHNFRKDMPTIVVENYLTEVESIGFGAMLIQRGALETMITKGAAGAVSCQPIGDYFDFFHARLEDVQDGRYCTEDVSFCRRWRQDCAGSIWAITNAQIFHVGDYSFGGMYHDLLTASEGEGFQ